jgi:phage terminase large subunit-like protein
LVAAPPRPRTVRRSPLKAVTIGPTWQRSRGQWLQPKWTIGWDVLAWTAEYLQQPDGPEAGGPWRFTPEQMRFALWLYEVNRDGRFVWRDVVLRRMKGWGKDPFGAAICAAELCGPVRFGGWRGRGEQPYGVSHPAAWIQTAAVSKEQTRNTMTLFPGLFTKKAINEYHIDLGKEIIYAERGQRRIEAVTSSPRALEGGRPTFVLKNETHHWIDTNEGSAMSEVINRNLAKSRDGQSRAMAITNAHNPGEDSVGEHDWDAYVEVLEGKTRGTGILYDSLEAPPETILAEPDSLRVGLELARGDSHWLDIDRLMQEIYDPRTPPSVARRFYLNQVVAAEDAWVAPEVWQRQARPRHEVPEGAIITLGLDGSKSDDHTAIVGCEVETSHLFLIGHWDPAMAIDGQLPRDEVDAVVHQAFKRYDVVGFYSDRAHFETYVDQWAEEFGDQLCVAARARQPVEWDMGNRHHDATKAAEAFLDSVVESALTHDGNATFTQHVINARNRPNNYGMTFGKESRFSSRKVDALAAAVLARQARQDYIALPENKKRQARVGSQIFV